MAYLRKENIIKTKIMKPLTEKYQLVAPVFLQNEHPISESNISLANNKKISHTKIEEQCCKKDLNSERFYN